MMSSPTGAFTRRAQTLTLRSPLGDRIVSWCGTRASASASPTIRTRPDIVVCFLRQMVLTMHDWHRIAAEFSPCR